VVSSPNLWKKQPKDNSEGSRDTPKGGTDGGIQAPRDQIREDLRKTATNKDQKEEGLMNWVNTCEMFEINKRMQETYWFGGGPGPGIGSQQGIR